MSQTCGALGTNTITYVLNGQGPAYSSSGCQYTTLTFTTDGWPTQIQSSGVTNYWKSVGLISGEDKGKIQSCAAQSNFP